ncbi:MAG: winged helix-turn-helix domain-containing protein [Bryobacteraceae bacterium]
MESRIVKFGAFQADLDSGELYRDGIRLKLGGQPFEVLETLVSRPGKVVTRDELRAAVWQSETFVDFDHGLNTAINKVREALCDDASNPRFVETVPRRGYRFIAPVVKLAAEAPIPPALPPVKTPSRLFTDPRPLRILLAAMATVVGLAAAAIYVWRYSQPAAAPSPAGVPFTSFPGAEYDASFSPDGKQVVFFWERPENSKSGIYIKSADSESEKVTPLVVKEPYLNYNPVWSPDGRSIAFLRRTPEAETWLHLIAPTGGPDRRIIRLTSSLRLLQSKQHLSWGPDGQWLLAPMVLSGTSLTIHRISLNGDAQPVTDPGSSSFTPSVSPDGRAFAFHSRTGIPRTAASRIFLRRLNTDGLPEGGPVLIREAEGNSNALAWAPNGKDLVSCEEHGGVGFRLLRMPARPGDLTPISSDDCTSVTVSRPDSSGRAMLLYGTSSIGGRARMWQARLDAMTDASELSPSSRSNTSPAFSPDGESIAFVSHRSGQPELWVAGLAGGDATRITNNAQVSLRLNWSPDGNHLVYDSASFTPFGSAIVPVTGGPSMQLPAGGQIALTPVWSRDGKFVYYTTGHQLWRVRPDGGEAMMLIDGDRYMPAGESPDGGSIYCARRGDPHAIYRIPRNGGTAELIEQGIATSTFAVTKKALYFVRDKDNALCRLPFHGGPAKKLGALPMPRGGASLVLSGLTVSPDDTRIVWATRDPQIDLMLIRDFQ